MSSVHKNHLTCYEEIIGDVISLHDRFPMAVIAYLYLIPKEPLIVGHKEYIDLKRSAQLYAQITERPYHDGYKDKYEHFAFLPVDFKKNPPVVLRTTTQLRINNFFDKILATYSQRNIFLSINGMCQRD